MYVKAGDAACTGKESLELRPGDGVGPQPTSGPLILAPASYLRRFGAPVPPPSGHVVFRDGRDGDFSEGEEVLALTPEGALVRGVPETDPKKIVAEFRCWLTRALDCTPHLERRPDDTLDFPVLPGSLSFRSGETLLHVSDHTVIWNGVYVEIDDKLKKNFLILMMRVSTRLTLGRDDDREDFK